MHDSAPHTSSWASQQLKEMSLRQKVSQLIVARANSFYTPADDEAYQRLVGLVEDLEVGGITFFQGEPLEQAFLTNDLQERSSVPLLVSQDLEYGIGMRLKEGTTFPSMMAVGASDDIKTAYSVGEIIAREARALGVHHVLAPVADVNNNPLNPIINVRSFGENPAHVAGMVAATIKGLQDGDVIATAKHFPGHGDTAVDSHSGMPTLPFNMERLESLELIPFYEAIKAGVRSIMVGHLAIPSLDSASSLPATLSRNVVTGLLRKHMEYQGLIVTDAMDMDGVCKQFGTGASAAMAIEAGIDMFMIPKDEQTAFDAILNAVEQGRIPIEQLDQSVLRILEEKERLNLHQTRLVDLNQVRHTIAIRPHKKASEVLAGKSLTLLRNENELIPLLNIQDRYVCITLSDVHKPEISKYFIDQVYAQNDNLTMSTYSLSAESHKSERQAALESLNSSNVVIVAAFISVRSFSGEIELPKHHRTLLNTLNASGKPVILISFGNPYIVMDIEQPDVYITAYSGCEASQKAVAGALFGQGSFPGRLPVTIPGFYDYGLTY